MKIQELKREYNKVVERLNNANKYWESCTDEEYEKSLGLYQMLIVEASKLCKELEKALNRPLTNGECLNGIEI